MRDTCWSAVTGMRIPWRMHCTVDEWVVDVDVEIYLRTLQ